MRKIRVLLILIGAVLIAYPFSGQIYAQKKQKLLLDNLYKTTDITDRVVGASTLATKEYSDLQKVFEEINNDEGALKQYIQDEPIPGSSAAIEKQLGGTTIATPKPALTSGQVLGRMLIDKINIDIPIIEGVSPEHLEISLGHLPGSSLIGEIGNTVIAGHRSHTFGYYFNRLDELEINDVVVIDSGSKTYKYIVYQKKIVEPTDVSVLKRSKSQSVLTLITCHPLFTSKQRLIVHAYLDTSGN